ncbi:MAG: hypothetical protein MJ197_08060 [Bacteroidales bacterium]|nr:hypothetical protein [Bacteroidales bacterium]
MKLRILTIITCCFVLISCSKNEYLDTTIDKPTVEFTQATFNKTISFVENNSSYDIAVPIQVFGGTTDASISVSIETSNPAYINDVYSIETTKSLHNNTLDSIHIYVNTTKLKKAQTYSIKLTISSEKVAIAKNYETCLVTFSQQAFMDFFTGSYSCYESSTNSTYNVDFTKLTDTTVKNNNFWDFPLPGQYVPFVFTTDEPQTVSIPNDYVWTDLLGNKYIVSGTGNYDLKGNFFVDFTMKQTGSEEIYQTGRQTYTKK